MGMNNSPQAAPESLVTIRAAALAVGVTSAVVRGWIDKGQLALQPFAYGRRVRLDEVQAHCAFLDSQTPPEAHPIRDVARVVGVSEQRIKGWARRSLLPSWPTHHGLLVREADVQALAQQHPAHLPVAEAAPLLPPDAPPIQDVGRLSGVSRGRIYGWIKRGLLPAWPVPRSGQRVRLADVAALVERPEWPLPPGTEREL